MSSYAYIAVDPTGLESRGTLEVADQTEALRRIKEMGLFPTKVLQSDPPPLLAGARRRRDRSAAHRRWALPIWGRGGRVKSSRLAVFTRQLATLIEAGMPLLRGLRLLHEQEESRVLRRIIGEMSLAIESGGSLSEAAGAHPRVFSPLYVNMVRAGELGGALEVTLQRLAEFMEKAQRIKGKIKAAMFYPCAVLLVAGAIVTLMTVFVVPRFQNIFADLLQGRPLPAFTRLVLHISDAVRNHIAIVGLALAAAGVLFSLALRTPRGRRAFDRLKLALPALGPVFRKAAISRFARTLGTLVGSGVPILQALTIVRETAGNVVVGKVIGRIHDRVKEGDPIAPTLKASGVFPAMVAGMVDIGEQTGALPELLMKVADNYDEEVDNAASAMTSLLEPVMIVLLAVVVGSIVIAMFLPIITITMDPDVIPAGREN